MPRTEIRGGQIGDTTVGRSDLNITTTGEAITRRIVAGTNINLGSTGIDTGTGDVTINATASAPSDITALSNATVSSSYPTGGYAFNATVATLGYPEDGRLTGTRNGTLHVQRLQSWATGSTYARNWIEGSVAWAAWSLYLDALDFTAKGQAHFSSAPNVSGVLSVGADNFVLTADSTQGLGVKWAASSGGGGGGLTWTEVTTTTQTAAVEVGYIANNAALVTITLPTSAALGARIRIVGKGAGGWRLSQNALQIAYFGSTNTITGVTGFLASSHRRDAIEIICVTTNTDWQVISSIGNITYV